MPNITLEIIAGSNTIPVVVNQDSAIERYLEARFRGEEWPFASSIEDDFAAAIVQTDAISGAVEYLSPGLAVRKRRPVPLGLPSVTGADIPRSPVVTKSDPLRSSGADGSSARSGIIA